MNIVYKHAHNHQKSFANSSTVSLSAKRESGQNKVFTYNSSPSPGSFKFKGQSTIISFKPATSKRELQICENDENVSDDEDGGPCKNSSK